MDGFLSNNWRDALAVFGTVLTLIQSLVLLRESFYNFIRQ